MSRSQRLVPLITAFGLCLTPIAENLMLPHPLKAQIQGGMELKLRRSQNSIEVVIEGVGQEPVLEQRHKGQSWEGRLRTNGKPGLRTGPHQQLSRPDLGLQYLSLSGSGESYQLSVVAVAGRPLSEPVVSADGQNLILSFPGLATQTEQTGRFDLRTPGRVPQDVYAPPLQQRAVAPPLGDMAVGTMVLSNRSFVQVSGPPVTLTLNNAPAKDALMSLARLGGYGYIYVDEADSSGTGNSVGASGASNTGLSSRPVSMSFENASYARALNGVLLASGLQGKLEGKTLLIGNAVAAKTFGPQVSKVYRLNQANAASAADYLASLGASISKVNVLSVASSGSDFGQADPDTGNANITSIETYGASLGPLRGLTGTTDSRLQTITLVGDSKLVAVAESYLKQIDLRSRQVALSVKILDVNLDNVSGMDNSFSMRFGDNLIVNDNGKLLAAFGTNMPANADTFTSAPVETESGVSTTTTQAIDYGLMYFVDEKGFSTGIIETDDEGETVKAEGMQYNPDGSVATNGGRGPILYDVTTAESSTTPAAATRRPNPASNYQDQAFYDFLRAQIISSNTKIMASPTLILSESSENIPGEIGRSKANEAFVRLGDKVVTAFSVTSDDNGNIYCEPEFETAGLSLGAMVSKIDDNGFVTFTLEPNLSAEVGEPVQQGQCGNITTVNERILETGAVRVRDGQTLILTGVISESDQQVVTKWPILGDIPVIGQFFRSKSGTKKKNELVIMVTPRIINDERGGTYGYGYQPSTKATRSLVYSK
ncbi:type II secretion system protein GspD [Prochlorococcus sp. MIT 1303]|uniref:type II secretion system protein GspD n=1 Tax=Prochlorococcus sp. MIT 1303 TaxID=1723647 RepID=UPI0007B393F2|nr:type II and III secretion system protein [Prochlorococcus sp. MIT 1303]KZR62089.1 Type IV pilus biogenesis and competence protein PilQ precursor [Prochlorococcus sp. MIT 1303]